MFRGNSLALKLDTLFLWLMGDLDTVHFAYVHLWHKVNLLLSTPTLLLAVNCINNNYKTGRLWPTKCLAKCICC